MRPSLLLPILLVCFASGAPAQNMLSNPGFETGTLAGWPSGTGDVVTQGWYFGAGPRNGSYAWGTASNWNTNSVAIQQSVAVSAGASYQAQGWFWVFCNSGMCAATQVALSVTWRDAAGTTLVTNTSDTIDATEVPQQSYFAIDQTWLAPANAASALVRFTLAVDARGGGGWAVCAADDLEFRAAGAVPTSTPRPGGQPFWLLTYGRQYGRYITGTTEPLCEPFAFYETGAPAVAVGITDRDHPGQSLFGTTDTTGKLRIGLSGWPQPVNVTINDALGVPASPSANVHWRPPLPSGMMYQFEFLFTRVPDYSQVTAYPYRPIYHYDKVAGFNTPTSEPEGMLSDANTLTEWSGMHSQTFVVPPEFNRIIATKVFAVNASNNKFRVNASVHENGPNGPQIGPTLVSREKGSPEFKGFMMCWGIDDVPVVPGGTYAINFWVEGGENVYVTSDNYPNGNLYVGGRSVPGQDLVAVVIGINKFDAAGPTPTRTPTRTPTASPMPTPKPLLVETW